MERNTRKIYFRFIKDFYHRDANFKTNRNGQRVNNAVFVQLSLLSLFGYVKLKMTQPLFVCCLSSSLISSSNFFFFSASLSLPPILSYSVTLLPNACWSDHDQISRTDFITITDIIAAIAVVGWPPYRSKQKTFVLYTHIIRMLECEESLIIIVKLSSCKYTQINQFLPFRRSTQSVVFQIPKLNKKIRIKTSKSNSVSLMANAAVVIWLK